ncbi:MAG: hypothetical protein KDC35_12665 [Acidobacteria bacterium]|nr:hypothetical protein [Acidobacteriota bacterium]
MATKAKDTKVLEEGGNVDKIREILFGGQMRQYERRFEEMEARIKSELDELRALINKQVSSLDEWARREVDRLDARNQDEKKERYEAVKKLEDSLRESSDQAHKTVQILDERMTSEQRELRAQMRSQAQSFEASLADWRESLKHDTTQLGQRLEQDKVSKQDLAGFLSEMALRLQGEFELPES